MHVELVDVQNPSHGYFADIYLETRKRDRRDSITDSKSFLQWFGATRVIGRRHGEFRPLAPNMAKNLSFYFFFIHLRRYISSYTYFLVEVRRSSLDLSDRRSSMDLSPTTIMPIKRYSADMSQDENIISPNGSPLILDVKEFVNEEGRPGKQFKITRLVAIFKLR